MYEYNEITKKSKSAINNGKRPYIPKVKKEKDRGGKHKWEE